MTDLLKDLNERQKEAALETEGYVRVIAGAGSGKTKLLVSRYVYLVQEYGIDAGNILCVTFTNKAAAEMKRRIRRLIGDGNDVSLICTYHGFCHRLLRENPEKLFLSKQFQIIDTRQQKNIMDDIYQKHELKLNHATFEAMLKKIGWAKRDMEYVKRICNPGPGQILREIRDQDDLLVEEFLQRQKATCSLDFHDLISFALFLLENSSEIREKWQRRLNYIMVDEFQDSTAVEMRLVEVLSGMYRNLMIVGDPDQNIYEWRGSDVNLLVNFDKEHDPTKTIIMGQNYRSTPQILQCANTLIEKNKLRLKKDLFTDNPGGAPVVHYHSKDESEEMDHVIANIRQLREREGLKYSDFAIIYRASFLSRMAEKKLVEKNIPYEIYGGVRFYQRAEILDVLAYLKLIAYEDDESFRRVVNMPRRRFGRVKMNILEELRRQGDSTASLFSTLSGNLENREFSGSDVGDFVRFMESIRGRYKAMRISEIVNTLTETSGYEQYMRELGDEERLSNLVEFKRIANEFEREFGEDISLEEFLSQIALQSGEDSGESKDAVRLMTIHSSKGLEFPVVFILGFTEGVFPSAKTMGDRKELGLEEERRLCYVAITRAEKYLFLMESEGTSESGARKMVSRFLEDIGEQNYVRIGRISEDLRQASKKYAAKLDWDMQLETAGSRKVGDMVEHHIFGPGVIEAIDEKRGSYSIRFDRFELPRDISSRYFTQEHGESLAAQKPDEPLQMTERLPEPETGTADVGELREIETDRDEPEVGIADTEKLWESGTDGNELETGAVDTGEFLERGTDWDEPETESADVGEFLERGTDRDELEVRIADTGEFSESETDGDSLETESADVGEILESGTDGEVPEVGTADTGELLESGTTAEEKRAARIKALKADSPNLWKQPLVPHSGWTCVGVKDLGAPVGICQMCGYQIIRYAHLMEHPNYHSLSVGCVCAGRMEGNVAEAKRRETDFKNRQSRLASFCKRQWKRSRKGNEYLEVGDHIAVLYHDTRRAGGWRYAIDNEFGKGVYITREQAVTAVFEALER